jgi:hypothetical protein
MAATQEAPPVTGVLPVAQVVQTVAELWAVQSVMGVKQSVAADFPVPAVVLLSAQAVQAAALSRAA